jgi:hypothetical protein
MITQRLRVCVTGFGFYTLLAANKLQRTAALFTCPLLSANSESQMERHFNSSAAADNKFNFNFNLLYSVYSYPNTILPFFGGYISDVLGAVLTPITCASSLLV